MIKHDRHGTIQQLANVTDIAEGTLSRLLVGHNRPDARNLKALCKALPEDEVAALLEAHLLDQVPEGYEHLVRVSANAEGRPGDQSIEKLKLNERVRTVLDNIANLFHEKPSSIAPLKMLAHYLRTDKVLPDCAYQAKPQNHIK